MIVALDPGITIGAAWCYEKINHYGADQFHRDYLWSFLDSARTGGMHRLIVESFVARNLPKIDLSPVEIIGVIKEWCRQNGFDDLVFQQPAHAKAYFTNSRLKRLGVYRPGSPHGMDALRHLLFHRGVFTKPPLVTSSNGKDERAVRS